MLKLYYTMKGGAIMEAIRNLLNTVVIESGDIHIDFGDMIVIFCILIAMMANLLLLVSLTNTKKK